MNDVLAFVKPEQPAEETPPSILEEFMARSKLRKDAQERKRKTDNERVKKEYGVIKK